MLLVRKERIVIATAMNILKITHNAGFFSCFSKKLEGIVWFFNTHKHLSDQIDTAEQFSLYKSDPSDDLNLLYFKDSDISIPYNRAVKFYSDMQFIDYKGLDFTGLRPFIEKYFSPSECVLSIASSYEKKYNIDYINTCAVFYRGNDKSTETKIAPYEAFISQAKKIKAQDSNIAFLVQTDETEFLEAFTKEFPIVIRIEEIPHMNKKISTIHDELPTKARAEFGVDFFAATLVLSKCSHLITHSGNCGLWAVLYRGSCTNVYQWLNHSWERSKGNRFLIWLKIECKKRLKKILKGNNGWTVLSFDK